MKTGYDQFFKKAQKAQKSASGANVGSTVRPSGKAAPASLGKGKVPTSKVDPKLHNRMSSQQMAQQLRTQMTPKKRVSKPIAWKMAGMSLIGLALTGFGMQNMEKIEQYAKRIEISVLGEAYAEEVKKDDKSAKPAAEKKEEVSAEAKTEVKKEFSVEEINHFAKLNDRKRELDAKETELGKMEAELASQKVELEKRIQELELTRKNISSVLEQKVQADDKKVATLVEVYSNMKPQQAAKIFETMDEDLAVEILGRMKKKNAAEVMNLVKAEKAQTFSEKYAGYKRK